MGYTSTFDIRATIYKLPRGIHNAKIGMKAIYDDLSELVPDESFELRANNSIVSVDEAYWYDYVDHMKKLSELYEGILFTVVVYGEEAGDNSCTYFYNGKLQKAEITYSSFDEEKLT